MASDQPDIRSNRLDQTTVEENFSDLHEPLSRNEALIEADRCYFCFDAPCTTACPTGIDIPGFIQKIRSDNLRGSAEKILEENIMGGMCARVCPTEILCEEACVRNTHEEKPVEIGLLQRYATEPTIEKNDQLFDRAAASGRKVCVIGGGPAGLSCAHRLAVLGHEVVVLCRDDKLGGLNEYGIAAYKTVENFAQREVDYILSVGGIEVRTKTTFGSDVQLDELLNEFDAVFLSVGLAECHSLGIDGEELPGVSNAIDYIADLRQAKDKSTLPVGREIVVIGGGMTAVDVAIQSKRLGAQHVHMVYRGTPEKMGASEYEQKLALTNGVTIHYYASPVRIKGDGHATGVDFLDSRTNEEFHLSADVVFKAIGQKMTGLPDIGLKGGRIDVDDTFKTSLDRVWAGGDCIAFGEDLTVSAVQHGKVAAINIDRYLRS